MKLTNLFRARQPASAEKVLGLPKKKKFMDVWIWIGTGIAASAALWGLTKDSLLVVLRANVDGVAVDIPLAVRVIVPLLLVVILGLTLLYAYALNGTAADAKFQAQQSGNTKVAEKDNRRDKAEQQRQARVDAELQRQGAETKRLAAEQAAINANIQAQVTALQKDGYSVERRTNERLDLLVADKTTHYGEIETADTAFYQLDSKGNGRLLMVAHLFANTAYWIYDSKVAFEDKNGDPFDFMRKLETTPSIVQRLKQYDLVIGVGLGSNTQHKIPRVARLRAGNFCGNLIAIVGDGGKPEVLGMSIGDYKGTAKDTPTNLIPQQRTALILGVKKYVDVVNERDVIDAILSDVGLPRADLSLYGAVQGEAKPEWIELKDCTKDRTF